jgi:hypothetical protein
MSSSRQREATCHCGQLRLRLGGDPALVSSCHCLACQRRTGALFGSTSFFLRYQLLAVEGEHKTWRRAGDSGRFLTFHFCPTCGSNVFWESEAHADMISVAVGCFADPDFPRRCAPSGTEQARLAAVPRAFRISQNAVLSGRVPPC